MVKTYFHKNNIWILLRRKVEIVFRLINPKKYVVEILENVFLKIYVWNVWWRGRAGDGLEHGTTQPLL